MPYTHPRHRQSSAGSRRASCRDNCRDIAISLIYGGVKIAFHSCPTSDGWPLCSGKSGDRHNCSGLPSRDHYPRSRPSRSIATRPAADTFCFTPFTSSREVLGFCSGRMRNAVPSRRRISTAPSRSAPSGTAENFPALRNSCRTSSPIYLQYVQFPFAGTLSPSAVQREERRPLVDGAGQHRRMCTRLILRTIPPPAANLSRHVNRDRGAGLP